jgi:hypothetical protein
MKKIFFIGSISLMVLVMPSKTFSQVSDRTKKITYTTLDVKKDYEVIKVVTGCTELTTTSKDSFLNAYTAAWANLATEAAKSNADAVVGIRVVNMADNAGNKVLIYGTAVKYK